MIHYHGTPIGGDIASAARFLVGRHALVSFARPDQMGTVAEACQSFILDNGAFSAWKRGKPMDVEKYKQWVDQWRRHPGFDWALIPDVIDGSEEENDALLYDWTRTVPYALTTGVPIWHLHETLERLGRLADEWPMVALGSSGEWPTPGATKWWSRMGDAMDAVCDAYGRPGTKIHGLRMMSPKIFPYLPFASADSTNAGVNQGSLARFGMYKPPTSGGRAAIIADRIEALNSAPVWSKHLPEAS